MGNKRQQLTEQQLDEAICSVAEKTAFRAGQKGYGVMTSSHEILGIIDEEVYEYRVEVHAKAATRLKIEELKDIAVAAIWGIASIESGGVDW